jgi:inner membrane protein
VPDLKPVGVPDGKGYFVAPVLIEVEPGADAPSVHGHEVFGPASTIVPYDGSPEEAAAIVARGQGGLVSSVYSDDTDFTAETVLGLRSAPRPRVPGQRQDRGDVARARHRAAAAGARRPPAARAAARSWAACAGWRSTCSARRSRARGRSSRRSSVDAGAAARPARAPLRVRRDARPELAPGQRHPRAAGRSARAGRAAPRGAAAGAAPVRGGRDRGGEPARPRRRPDRAQPGFRSATCCTTADTRTRPSASRCRRSCWAALLWLWPAVRRLAGGERRRLATLAVLGLASHLALDSWNVYGIHPWAPFDARWFYGDAVFIFEPWLWLLLAGALAANAGEKTRAALAVGLAVIVSALGAFGVVAPGAVAALALGAVLWAMGLRALRPRARVPAALAAGIAFVATSFVLAQRARVQTVALLPARERIVDVVRSPQPAAPLCWSVIAVTTRDDAYVLRRGRCRSRPGLQEPARCGLHATARLPTLRAEGPMLWTDEIVQPRARLRALERDDCWVRAWLQFARAPVDGGGRVFDLRFETLPRDNFTALPLGRAGCPANVTRWTPPRADLLAPR